MEKWIRVDKETAKRVYESAAYNRLHRLPENKTPEESRPFPFVHNNMYKFERYVELLEMDPDLTAPLMFYVLEEVPEQELQEADARPDKMGVTVDRAQKKFPSLDEIIKEASKRTDPGDPPPGGGAPAKEFSEKDKEKMEESKKLPQPRFISPSR